MKNNSRENLCILTFYSIFSKKSIWIILSFLLGTFVQASTAEKNLYSSSEHQPFIVGAAKNQGGYYRPAKKNVYQRRAQKNSKDSFWDSLYGNISAGVDFYQYTEPDVMSISGPMYNVSGMLGFRYQFLRTDMSLLYSQDIGNNIYDGAVIETNNITGVKTTKPLKEHSNDYYIDATYRIGLVAFQNEQNDSFSFYLGLGYWYLDNQMASSSAYRREQQYLYLPIGTKIRMRLNETFRLRLDAELRPMLRGWNISRFGEMQERPYANNLHFTQKNGIGFNLAVGTDIFLTKKQYFLVQFKLNYWKIDDSNVQPLYRSDGKFDANMHEPKNHTFSYGISVGYGF